VTAFALTAEQQDFAEAARLLVYAAAAAYDASASANGVGGAGRDR
jgi:hypothetical protein